MELYAPQTVDGYTISVTGTATSLFNLIDTASPGSSAQFPGGIDGINFSPEDGDVRGSWSPALTPTATKGVLFKQGVNYFIRHQQLKGLVLIRTAAANVKCSLQVGMSFPDEPSSVGGGGGSSSTTSQGTYNATPPTLADGGTTSIQFDVNGNQKVVEQGAPKYEDNTNQVAWVSARPGVTTWTVDKSIGSVTKRNVKASAGYAGGVYVSNRNAALRYFQIHAKATAPAGADVPLYSFEIPINGALVLDGTHFGLSGDAIATGIGWAISTTNATFTDSATAAEHNVYFRWV